MGLRTNAVSLLRLLTLTLLLAACGSTPKAYTAIRDGSIDLKTPEAQVMQAAGPPQLILAAERVETFYYQNGDAAVAISILDGKVVAFDDGAVWPKDAFEAADDASEPVSTGKVRVGMSEQLLLQALGKPNGMTAKDGIETMHWLSGDDIDSFVSLDDRVVVGYADVPISEFSQNLPTANRDVGTTSGKVRLGMSQEEVARILEEEPTRTKGKKGVVEHQYKSNPVFGDHIVYSVSYREGKVVAYFEHNVSRAEELQEEKEAQQAAAAAKRKSEGVASTILGVLNNPLVKSALASSPSASVKHDSSQKKEQRTLIINGKTYTGGPDLGRPCAPDNDCPGGYTCLMQTSSSGLCVQ